MFQFGRFVSPKGDLCLDREELFKRFLDQKPRQRLANKIVLKWLGPDPLKKPFRTGGNPIAEALKRDNILIKINGKSIKRLQINVVIRESSERPLERPVSRPCSQRFAVHRTPAHSIVIQYLNRFDFLISESSFYEFKTWIQGFWTGAGCRTPEESGNRLLETCLLCTAKTITSFVRKFIRTQIN